MNNRHIHSLRWSTSSFGNDADTSSMELSALGEHLNQCNGSRGRLIALQCTAQKMEGFVAARFVTTLVVAALLTSVGIMVL